jgi:penicillin-binding protein 1A
MPSKDLLRRPPEESNWRGPSGLKRPFYSRWWFKLFFWTILLSSVAGVLTYKMYVLPLRDQAETFDLEEIKKLEIASIIYDRYGGELGKLYITNRTPITLKQVPKHFQDALLAQEDSRYYQHQGVDWYGVGRAVYQGVLRKIGGRGVNQGASTITQQLGRQTFQLLERELSRKILEWYLALRIEKKYSKEDIMEHYLNRIFFGSSGTGQNFYGVQSAAQGYFGKNVTDLTLDESATLVGLIKAPNTYSPLRNAEAAIKGRNIVLDRMAQETLITPEVAEENKRKPMVTVAASPDSRMTYYYDAIRKETVKIVGEERASIGGFHIYTSIDPDLQHQADEALKKRLAEVETMQGYAHQTYTQYRNVLNDYRQQLKDKTIPPNTPKPKPEYLQGAALIIDNSNGAVLAVVGGRDFKDSEYNRAFDSARATGTCFTPFVYAQAFTSPNFYPGSQLEDSHFDNSRAMVGGSMEGILGEWGAESMDTSYSMGKITAREALSTSKNAPTMRLAYAAFSGGNMDKPNLKPLLGLTTKAGIQSQVKEYPSSFLGTSEIKLSEMCLAYTIFPNLGERPVALTIINRITDSQGGQVFQTKQTQEKVRVIDEIAAYQTHSCLVDALQIGTGRAARLEFGLKNFPAAGKTGTHSDYKDLWFMGYSSRITCGVWVGFDKLTTIAKPPNAFSSRIALPIWCDLMNAAQSKYSAELFTTPAGMERVEICKHSGLRASDYCYAQIKQTMNGKEIEHSIKTSYIEYVRPGTTVSTLCNIHTGSGKKDDNTDQVKLTDFQADIGKANTTNIADPTNSKFSSVEPVTLQSATILGEDPFESVVPVPKARVVPFDGAEVKRPEIVEDAKSETEAPIKLAPPKAIKVE